MVTPATITMYLVVVDKFLQFICMDNNMQATHLGQTELLPIHTGKTHLQEKRVILNKALHLHSIFLHYLCTKVQWQTEKQKTFIKFYYYN